MARPSTYDDEKADKIIQFIAAGASREDAGQAIGVRARTLQRWMRAMPEFCRRVMEADATATIVAERSVYTKDPLRWLEAHKPRRWGKRIRVDIGQMLEDLDAAIEALESPGARTSADAPEEAEEP